MIRCSKFFPLAGVFAAGCVFTVLVLVPAGQIPSVQTLIRYSAAKEPRIDRSYTENRQDKFSVKTVDREVKEARVDREPVQQSPRPRPAVKLPLVKDVLPKANFSNNRKEDSKLATLRKRGLVSSLPDDKGFAAVGSPDIVRIAHSYLDNADIVCKRKLRMGKVGNGGWEVCDDYEWRPMAPCLVYSFGINYDFSFDDDVGRVYGCDVYSFDPSMSKQPTYQRSERVMFYRYGLGGQSGSPAKNTSRGWILHSLSNFKAMLNHTDKVIDVIKMDVESWEWEALTTMINERQLDNVRQLLVEFHISSQNPKFLRPRLQMLASLERVGFRKFYITKNKACARPAAGFPIMRTKCYEVHFVNINFKRPPLNSSEQAFGGGV